jgi:hypothetical protein
MERYYRKYINTLRRKTGSRTSSQLGPSANAAEDTVPQQHYTMAKRDRDRVDLYALSNKYIGDPALKVGNIRSLSSLPF